MWLNIKIKAQTNGKFPDLNRLPKVYQGLHHSDT